MARIARIEEPFYPYHVIQRGNRNQNVFLRPTDKGMYLRILKIQADFFDVEVWAYCLMDNHVHLIMYPKVKNGLTACMSQTHQQYTRMINFREDWRGHLWQGRFKSFPLDAAYLFTAVRYVEVNPVRAKMVKSADNYPYSSARARINKTKDALLSDFYLLKEIKDWRSYLTLTDDKTEEEMRKHQRTGRPLGDKDFIAELESKSGQDLTFKKSGPKSKKAQMA